MAQRNRDDIKANFRTGDRPTEEQFADVFDSYVNIIEDQLSFDSNLNVGVGGSITLTNNGNSRNEPGTIRWNGTEFEIFDPASSSFIPLGSGSSVWASLPGDDIFYDVGNVAIGPVSSLSDRFEVELDSSNRRTRIGNTSLGNGPDIALRNHAVFSHTNNRDESNYALVQGPDGDVRLNAADGQVITLRVGNNTAAAILRQTSGGYLVINAPETLNANSAFHLQVNGSAFKNDSEGEWNVTSDIRTKKKVQAFKDGLDKLRRVKPVKFEYNGKGNTIQNLKAIGVSAQEIQKVFPYMVQGINGADDDEKDYLTTNTSSMKYVMVNAINELAERVEKLEKSVSRILKKLD